MTRRTLPASAALLAVLAISMVSALAVADVAHAQTPTGKAIIVDGNAEITAPNTIVIKFNGTVQATVGTFSDLTLYNGTDYPGYPPIANDADPDDYAINTNVVKVEGDSSDPNTSDGKAIGKTLTLTFQAGKPVSPYVWGNFKINNETGSDFAITVPDGSSNTIGIENGQLVSAAAAQAPSVVEDKVRILDNDTLEVVFSEPVTVRAGSFIGLQAGSDQNSLENINLRTNPGTTTDTLTLKFAGTIDQNDTIRLTLPSDIVDRDGNPLGYSDTANPARGVINEEPKAFYAVTDTRDPTLNLLSFTSKGTITASFSTPVQTTIKDVFGSDGVFTDLSITSFRDSDGVTIETITPSDMRGNGTDTLTFRYALSGTNDNGDTVRPDRDDIPSDLTGNVDIDYNKLKGVYGFGFDDGSVTDVLIADSQPPVLVTAAVTGPRQVMLTFSEDVQAGQDDFSNVRIDGAAKMIDSVSTSAKVVTLALTSTDALPTDATGTVDIADTLADMADDSDNTHPAAVNNTFAGAEGQRLADMQPPTVTAKVTDLDTVTIEFSERVDATAATFRALTINDGTNTNDYPGVSSNQTSIPSDRTTVTITFAPKLAAGESDAYGTVDIPGAIRDDARNLMLNTTGDFADTDTLNILAGQRPDVESAKITGPNQATVTFTEAVVADTSDFKSLMIDHNGDSFDNGDIIRDDSTVTNDDAQANVLRVSGSGTDTITLTFDGTPASSVAMGYVTLDPTLEDRDGAELGTGKTNNDDQFGDDGAANLLRLDDGQAILIGSAGVTAPNKVTVMFSEPPTAGPDDFDNLRIAGESADRKVTGVAVAGKNATVTFDGDGVPTDATARIDILDTVTGKDTNSLADTAPAYAVADWQSPKLMKAPAITDSNTITVVFSEAVTASKGSFELSGGDLEGRTVGTVTGSGTDTLRLGFSGTTTPTNATGMLAMDAKVMDLAAAPNAFVENDNDAVDVADAQPPVIESAGITDSSKITIVFSEAVVADDDGADFANLVLNGNDTRTVRDVAGSDTATLVLTFNGTAPRGATATIDVAGTINDTADNPLAAVAGLEVTADQVPMVESAAITGPNTVTITFSEPVAATKDAFNGLSLSPGGPRNINDCKYGDDTACGTSAKYSDTVTLAFGGVPAAPNATATVNIAVNPSPKTFVVDEQGNAIDPLTAYPIEAGQVPTVKYAKFEGDDTATITIRFSEPIVNATKSAFTGLVLSPGGPRNVEACYNSSATPQEACAGLSLDTVFLTFDGSKAPQNVTATLGIAGMSLNDTDGNALEAVPSLYVAASQQPVLVSAGLTGPNTITMAFSERVVADADSFDDLSLAGEAAGRTVTAVSGSNTGTVTLTFGGTPAGAGATGTIDVEGLTDTAMQEIAPLRSYSVTDMQPPTVESAVITAPNVITVAFSETVTASVSSFADLMITAAGQQPTSRTVTSVNNSTEPVTARTMVVAFGGPQATTGFSGTVDIAGVTDGAGNALAPLDDLPLTVGSLGPGILSGTVYADTNDNNVRDSGEAGIAGLTVIMVDTNDVSRMFTDTTANDGTYSFDQIEFGSVLVQVAPLPQNHLPATGTLSYVMTTIEPASVTPVDFALYPVPAIQQATVSGKVYDDRNANGEFDAGTDAGLPNVPVFVVDFLTLTQTSVNTTATGDYTIAGVLPDTVLVQAHPLPFEYITHGDANSYAYVTPARGQTVTVDFPLDAVDPSETGTIFIEVFADTNGNGVRDAGEPGVEGATVYTFELLTTTTNVQVTDNTGITTHPRLIPDVVLAQINHHVLPDGFTGITTVNGGFEYVPVTPQSTTTVSIGLN